MCFATHEARRRQDWPGTRQPPGTQSYLAGEGKKKSSAFTLVELLVVIAIIGILIALLLPAVQAAREAARRAYCSNQMKQIGLALHNYHSSHRVFPPGVIVSDSACTASGATRRQAPWTVQILPFLELEPLYRQFNMEGRFVALSNDSEPSDNEETQNIPVAAFHCPSDPAAQPEDPSLNYFGVQGGGSEAQAECAGGPAVNRRLRFNNGIFHTNSAVRFADVTDGTTHTILVGESRWWSYERTNVGYHNWFTWASCNRTAGASGHVIVLAAAVDPINNPLVDYDSNAAWVDSSGNYTNGNNLGTHTRCFGSRHPGGCHMTLADASVRFFAETMDLATYRSMGTRSDGLPTGGDAP